MRRTPFPARAAMLALAAALLAPAAAHAQAPADAAGIVDADPALWVVRDADTTIYLFGTVHVLKPGLGWFDEAVREAFDASGEVVMEIIQGPPAEAQATMLALAAAPPGSNLRAGLPADQRRSYERAMGVVGIPVASFDPFDPWFAAVSLSTLPLIKAGYDPASGVEVRLTEAAREQGKTLGALETLEEQLGLFDALAPDAQKNYLHSVTAAVDDLPAQIDAMVKEWAEGDADGLAALLNASLADPELYRVLLTDRNERWADWIVSRMAEPGTVFVAVGAGHLAGTESVQEKLAVRGLEVERVDY